MIWVVLGLFAAYITGAAIEGEAVRRHMTPEYLKALERDLKRKHKELDEMMLDNHGAVYPAKDFDGFYFARPDGRWACHYSKKEGK